MEEKMRTWLEMHVLARENMAAVERAARDPRWRLSATPSQPTVKANRPQAPTLILARGEVLTVNARRGSLRITCVTGRVWATGSRSTEDLVLLPGDATLRVGKEKLVLEALRTAVVRLEYPQEARASLGVAARPALVMG